MTNSSDQRDDENHAGYWRANLRILSYLVAIWFLVSFGMSILAVDWLDQFMIMGFPFGFWMAQQGSIIAFLLIILVYMLWMNRIDKQHGVEEEPPDSTDFEI